MVYLVTLPPQYPSHSIVYVFGSTVFPEPIPVTYSQDLFPGPITVTYFITVTYYKAITGTYSRNPSPKPYTLGTLVSLSLSTEHVPRNMPELDAVAPRRSALVIPHSILGDP
jgi:hypothetical protein